MGRGGRGGSFEVFTEALSSPPRSNREKVFGDPRWGKWCKGCLMGCGGLRRAGQGRWVSVLGHPGPPSLLRQESPTYDPRVGTGPRPVGYQVSGIVGEPHPTCSSTVWVLAAPFAHAHEPVHTVGVCGPLAYVHAH